MWTRLEGFHGGGRDCHRHMACSFREDGLGSPGATDFTLGLLSPLEEGLKVPSEEEPGQSGGERRRGQDATWL